MYVCVCVCVVGGSVTPCCSAVDVHADSMHKSADRFFRSNTDTFATAMIQKKQNLWNQKTHSCCVLQNKKDPKTTQMRDNLTNIFFLPQTILSGKTALGGALDFG